MASNSPVTKDEPRVDSHTGLNEYTTGDVSAARSELAKLISACRDSEALLITASEHAQNRGVKILLRVYAYHRRKNAEELAPFAQQERQVQQDVKDNPAQGLHQGVVDIQAAMTVGRENRTHVVLEQLLKEEKQLASAYEDVLANTELPQQLRPVVQHQYEQEQIVHQQLQWLEKDGYEDLVVRLFDDPSQAESAVNDLSRQGFDERYVSVARVRDLPVRPANREALSGTTKNTFMAGVVTGGVAGAVIGLIYAVLQWLVPAVSAMLSVDPIILLISSAVIGAFWGGVLGTLIGAGTREDDAYLYGESMQEGDTLVVVHANDANMSDVLETLKLYHERELDMQQ